MPEINDYNEAALNALIASLGAPGVDPEGPFPIETPIGPDWKLERAVAPLLASTDSTDIADEAPPETEPTPTPAPSTALADVDAVFPAVMGQSQLEAIERHDDGRPIIKVRPAYMPDAMRLAEACLGQTGRYFQRGRAIVEVQIDPATQEITVDDLNPISLAHALAGVSAWMRLDKRTKSWELVDPVERVCKALVGVHNYEVLQVLKGTAQQPYLRPDGTLCQAAGHDPATGLFGVFKADEFNVPEAPTREQAEQALDTLTELITEFPFATPHDKSAALAAMLTAAIRPSLAQAPMFHVRAPQIASGKSYLCSLITALATPGKGSPVPFPTRDEECSKLLLALLKGAPAVIEFDNLTDDIKPFKSLCSVLTEEHLQGRVLGRTKMLPVGTRAVFLSSGNNVGPSADMARRCVTINLDPGCELPAARAFKRSDLIGDVRRDRSRYVAAALTLVRAWITAGRPKTETKPLASYMDWLDLCCQPLMWLGLPDPTKAVFDGMAADPDRILLGQFLSGWRGFFADKVKHGRDVIAHVRSGCPGGEDFEEVLLEVTGDRDRIDGRKLGKWMARNQGRVVSGLRLEKAPTTRNVASWRVESVKSHESVAVAPLE